MKRILLSALGLLALGAAALAQVNTVPQTGVTTGYVPKVTYSSAFFGLAPVLTAGTDEVCISGSATKVIRVQRITVYGTTATNTQNLVLNLVRRTSLDTGGTPAGTTANPGITTQIASRDTGQNTNISATAVLISYTAAPTIVDSAPVFVDSQNLYMPLVASVSGSVPADFYFGRDAENNIALVTLRGAAQQLCVNNATTILAASLWNGSIVWTEE